MDIKLKVSIVDIKSKVSIMDIKVSKGAKIRNRYNKVPQMTQDTSGKVRFKSKLSVME